MIENVNSKAKEALSGTQTQSAAETLRAQAADGRGGGIRHKKGQPMMMLKHTEFMAEARCE